MPLTEYDDIINSKKPASIYRYAESVLSALTLDAQSVLAELSHFEATDLSNDDTTAIERSLNKAAIWLLASLRPTPVNLEDVLPDDVAIVKDIVLKMAIAALADHSGQSGLAKEKRMLAERLARALFGASFPSEEVALASPPAGAIARPVRRPPCPY
jgi:hypothetical protein